jgi:hypothetical protein
MPIASPEFRRLTGAAMHYANYADKIEPRRRVHVKILNS